MPDIESQLKKIQDKLHQLLKQHSVLQKENYRLKEELEQSTKEVLVHQQQIEDLKQQVEVLKITSGSWDENDRKAFEKRINLYVKEIDRCIALLSE